MNVKEYNFDRQTERNYGLDLLRIVSMYLVVLLHIIGGSGLLESQSPARYAIGWLLEVIPYCAVNCFALLSGYVGYKEKEEKYRYGKYFSLWFQVVFYGVLINTIGKYLANYEVGIKEFIKSVFTVSFSYYWYFTAFTGVFFLVPWLNRFVRNCKIEQLDRFVVLFFSLFSGYTTLVGIAVDPFVMYTGYSFLWLCMLYIIGAWMKKKKLTMHISKKRSFCLIWVFVIITWCSKLLIARVMECVFGMEFGADILIHYTSPTVLGEAIMLVLLFARIRIPKRAVGWIKLFSPAAFGVYLIHVHPLVFNEIIGKDFRFISNLPILAIIPVALFSSLAVLILGLVIDKMRIEIFKIMKIGLIGIKLESALRQLFQNVAENG